MYRSWSTPQIVAMAWVVCFLSAQTSFGASSDFLNFDRQSHGTVEIPILIETAGSLKPGQFLLKGFDDQTATVFNDRGKTYLATVFHQVPTNETKLEFSTEPSANSPGHGVELITKNQRIEFRIDGKLVTEYIPDDGPKPYFFPLIGPSGSALTRSFPMKKVEGEKLDHPHHRSLWFTHGSVNKVDFWSELPGHGRIIETSRPTIVSGNAVGRLRTTDDWVGPDGKKICEDERVVTIYATTKNRILDFDLTLKASNGPVTFGDTKEGMFGLRVATSMDVTSKLGGKIINADGILDQKAWGKASSWVDYTGPVDGKTVGIAILNHPSSFRYPTTWHVRDYGLFAANPFGYHDFGQKTSGEFRLTAGESIRFRYRLILHDGDHSSAELPAAFQAYVEPPKIMLP